MSMSIFARRFLMGAFVCAFLGGCSSDPAEPNYGFGEADMQNAIVGDWSGMMSLTGQMPTAFTMSITQVPALQPACGSRTFNSPLCIESSSMMLDATLTTTDKVFDAAKLTGELFVIGLEMNSAELSLSGAGVTIAGSLDAVKTSHDLTISGNMPGSATMQR